MLLPTIRVYFHFSLSTVPLPPLSSPHHQSQQPVEPVIFAFYNMILVVLGFFSLAALALLWLMSPALKSQVSPDHPQEDHYEDHDGSLRFLPPPCTNLFCFFTMLALFAALYKFLLFFYHIFFICIGNSRSSSIPTTAMVIKISFPHTNCALQLLHLPDTIFYRVTCLIRQSQVLPDSRGSCLQRGRTPSNNAGRFFKIFDEKTAGG